MRDEINKLFARIEEVKRECGITREITVVAATKTVSPERINELPKYGIKIAGENRVQELLDKYDEVHGLEWHFIGALQTNKVKYIIDKVDMVESLDSPGLARELQRQAEKHGRVVDVLIEINIGREPAKSGVLPEDAEELVRAVCGGYDRLRLRGFMTMAPKGDAASYRRLFGEMRRLSESLWELTPGRNEPMVLSMGMSDSYRYAVAEGATLVRVGRALFARGDGDTE